MSLRGAFAVAYPPGREAEDSPTCHRRRSRRGSGCRPCMATLVARRSTTLEPTARKDVQLVPPAGI